MFLRVINPTMHFQVGNVAQIPIENTPDLQEQTKIVFDRVLSVSRTDWDAYETSWDFTENPLVAMRHDIVNLVDSVEKTNSDSFEASLTLRQNQGMRNVSGASEKSEFQIEALYRARDCEEMRRLNPADRTNSDSSEASLTLRQNQGMRNVSGASEKSEFQIEALYKALRERWARDCEEMRRLETENNRIFIEAYGLQDELTPDVPWQEITLTCNPWYRYGVKCNSDSSDCLANARQPQEMRNDSGASEKSEFQKMPRDPTLEERLRSDTVKELVSYAVGCMMGRYSLEKPGLILADQGATVADYWEKLGMGNGELGIRNKELGMGNEESGMGNEAVTIPHSSFHIPHSFAPDEDGIIPILDNDWFEDDIVTRFKAFIKVAFGEDHFFENMAWIEEALGKDIRSYFTKDFYKDHLQRYQNRPIYWLFQSPKGAFRALVYMHRYKPDMVGGVLGYLRSLQTKIDNQLDVAMRVGADEAKSASERVRANKDAVKYAKAKKELDEYERNVLYPLSTERIEIDLDDGVKVNYRKFASALAKVKALEAKGE